MLVRIVAQGAEGVTSRYGVQPSSKRAPAGTECNSLLLAAAAKFTGSGGAAVALCPEGVRQGEALQEACRKAGFECIQIQVGPPHSLPDMPDSHELPDALTCSASQL